MTCDVRTRHKVWMEAVRKIKQIENHYQIQAFWHLGRRQEGADRRRAQRCMDYLRAKSEVLEGERLERMDFDTRFPDAEPTRYINLADAITEVTFIHMREQMKGVLQIQRDEWTKMSMRRLDRMRRAMGLLYPLEHSVRGRSASAGSCTRLAPALHSPRIRLPAVLTCRSRDRDSLHRRCSGVIGACPAAPTTTSMASSMDGWRGALGGRATSSPSSPRRQRGGECRGT